MRRATMAWKAESAIVPACPRTGNVYHVNSRYKVVQESDAGLFSGMIVITADREAGKAVLWFSRNCPSW